MSEKKRRGRPTKIRGKRVTVEPRLTHDKLTQWEFARKAIQSHRELRRYYMARLVADAVEYYIANNPMVKKAMREYAEE